MSSLNQKSAEELPRGFGFWTGWFVVLAAMIGSGILANSGIVLASTGNYSSLFLLWIVGGALALLGALTLGELASGMPQAGGEYIYVRAAFGPALGFVYGWTLILIGFAAPIALIAFTTSNYLYPSVKPFLGEISQHAFVSGCATFLILFFSLSHCLGQKSSARVQMLTTSFNVLLLASFAAIGLFSGKGDWSHLAEGPSFSQVRGVSLATGLILVMYAYTGWNAAAYLGGEIKNAAKVLPAV